MPELSEVEVARLRVESWWKDRAAEDVKLHDKDLVSSDDASLLTDLLYQTARSIRRRGKYLIVDFDDGHVMFHFRMTGKITTSDQPKRRFTRLSWLIPEVGWLVFDDSRRIGDVRAFTGDPLEHHPPLSSMGPEPHDLRDGAHLSERLGKSKRRLKDALLDQKIIAGVGNIAISELFWRVGVHPETRCHEISIEALDALVDEMPIYFDWLVEDQMADEIVYLGEGKGAVNPFSVYKREDEVCPRCDDTITRATFGGRSTYFCPGCQPK